MSERQAGRVHRATAVAPGVLVVLLLGLAPGCKSTTENPETAAEDLQRLERVLADTADLRRHPVLTDADLDPLRQLALRDVRVARARDACVRQYEAIVRAQDDLARCRDLENMLEARMHDLNPDAADPAFILAEAQQVCARAFTATDQVDGARKECDEAIGGLRRALGQPN